MEWNRVFFCPRGISLATTSVHCLLLCPSKKNLSSLQPSFRYCRLSQIPALAASSAPTPKGCYGLSLDCISFSEIPQGLLQWRAQLDTALQDAASRAQKGGVITVLVLFSQVQPSVWLAFIATRAHCWLAFNSLSTGNPGPAPQSCSPAS